LDSGCEGTLVSFYNVPFQALKNIIHKYENRQQGNSFDEKQFDYHRRPNKRLQDNRYCNLFILDSNT